MKIILSPAKKMKTDTDSLPIGGLPELLPRTEIVLGWMKQLSDSELQTLWNCSDKIAQENIARLKTMNLRQKLRRK